MTECVVLSPISLEGGRREIGETVELEGVQLARLLELGCVEPVKVAAARKAAATEIAELEASAREEASAPKKPKAQGKRAKR